VIHSTNAFNYLLKALMALPQFISQNKILLTTLVGAILAYNGALIKSIGASILDTATRIKAAIVLKATTASQALQAEMTMVQATQTKALTMWQRAAVTVQWALNAAMAANPVGMVIAGITALVVALMYFSKNSRENLELENTKKVLTQDLTKANQSLKTTYEEIGTEIGNLNKLSVQEKTDLDDKISKTITLAEAELDLLTARRGEVKASSSKVTAGQFIGSLFNPDKLKEKARENGLKAVAPLDELIQAQSDRIKSLRAQKTELEDILQAESQGDTIGTGTTVELESKLERYTTALKNVTRGSEDYIRIQNKIKQVEGELAKERGASESADKKFDREKALADIAKSHEEQLLLIKTQYAQGITDKETYTNDLAQEDIRYQMESIARLQKHGQSTIAEEQKVQDLLIGIRENCDKEAEDAAKAHEKSLEMWDEEYEKFLKDLEENPDLTEDQKKRVLEYQYWWDTNAQGQREKLQMELDANVISQTEYYDKIKALDKEAAEKKLQHLEQWAGAATSLAETVGQFMQAQKDRELAAAGKDDKKKEAIERKYAKRQKTIATAQALIEGALEIARINSNAGVNADLTQTLRVILTGLAVARTAGTIAVIQSQQFASGRYPVMGADDNQIYQASLLGKVRTGIYTKPTLGLFSEKEPEIVIDGPTTRNIKANFPEILGAINAARVNQYSEGKYPDLGGSQATNDEMIGLLKANLQMMREVRDAHKRPAVVSFQSLRDRQGEFDVIKAKTRIG